MLEEITQLQKEGQYERALNTAKRSAIGHLKNHEKEGAAALLAHSGALLCQLNHPSKARSFALEAIDLSSRGSDTMLVAYSRSVAALAHIRLGELEKADPLLDIALETLHKSSDDPRTISAQLVAAELSLVREEYDEARIFSEDALSAARKTDRTDLVVESLLASALCEERDEKYAKVIELLGEAENLIEKDTYPHNMLLIEAMRVKAYEGCGEKEKGQEALKRFEKLLNLITATMGHDLRERFLKSPVILSAHGNPSESLGSVWKPTETKKSSSIHRDETAKIPAAKNLRPILDIIKKINSELNLRKLITIILDTMIEYCNAQRGTILIFEGEKFKVEIARNKKKQDLKRFQMGLSRTVLRQVRDKGQMIVLKDAKETPNLRIVDSVHEQSLMSVLCVPLRVKSRLVGAVYLDNQFVTSAFGASQIEYAEILTDHAAVAIDNALLHIKAIHDGLTSLFNHAHFEKRIDAEVARARRHGRTCGLIMLDIDDFKKINDRYGHETGNQILRDVSSYIGTAVRNIDLVARIQERDPVPVIARYGGDEFEILLPETDMEGLTSTAKRILDGAREEKFVVGGVEIPIAFSLGGALFPDHAPDARELALRADEALYEAKKLGKNRFHLYEEKKPEEKPSE